MTDFDLNALMTTLPYQEKQILWDKLVGAALNNKVEPLLKLAPFYNLNEKNIYGETLLLMLAKKPEGEDNSDAFQAVLNLPIVEVYARDYDNNSALILAIKHRQSKKVKALLDYPQFRAEGCDDKRNTPLILAAALPNIDWFDDLLKMPYVAFSSKNRDGVTAVMAAAGNYDSARLKSLFSFSRSSDSSGRDNNGETALMYAVRKGLEVNIDILKEHSTFDEINVQNNKGETALIVAAQMRDLKIYNPKVIPSLLKFEGLDANLRDAYGQTALIHLVRRDAKAEEIKNLVEVHGFDPKPRDNVSQDAYDYAKTDEVRAVLDPSGARKAAIEAERNSPARVKLNKIVEHLSL